MFRIRRIFDDISPANKTAMKQACDILAAQFSALKRAKIDAIPDIVRDPIKYGFRSVMYVAETSSGKVRGCALLSHEMKLRFAYLDYLAADKGLVGRGIGAALYQRMREEALVRGVTGLFYECLPDDPALCSDPDVLAQSQARLRFYESFGARPIVNTAYETPLKPGGDNPPYLVFDDLGQGTVLRAAYLRDLIRCVLERKYKHVCTPEYVALVVNSVVEDPVRLRDWRYLPRGRTVDVSSADGRVALVVSDQHELHHIRERGYFEAPVRIRTILDAIIPTGLFTRVAPGSEGARWLPSVHDAGYLQYIKRVCESLEPDETVYPYVFPLRNNARPPIELAVRAGYYCIDTFTPLTHDVHLAARRAVDCALTAAQKVVEGARVAYALVRPPGHHAEKSSFGGFCYFNNAAVAAHYLSRYGRVALLDIDYHHGNGQERIFYRRDDVLTVSIHGHPSFAFPYFSGFADERGEGAGKGFNINYPLPETINAERYLATLDGALKHLRAFRPAHLVVCLGLDTAKGDPTGSWPLRGPVYKEIGLRIAAVNVPTVVVQEGGYDNRTIGANARQFFTGLCAGEDGRPCA
ncbi:histone deacetylase family protein [bacterium]|nr:histone deacetylase family protein [bacterium]